MRFQSKKDKKSDHTFLPLLGFTTTSLYLDSSNKTNNSQVLQSFGFVKEKDEEEGFIPPHRVHKSWCRVHKDFLNCTCKLANASGPAKQFVRIECTLAHVTPIVDLATEAQEMGLTDLAIDILECMGPQKFLEPRKRALTMVYPVLTTDWNKKYGTKSYLHTDRRLQITQSEISSKPSTSNSEKSSHSHSESDSKSNTEKRNTESHLKKEKHKKEKDKKHDLDVHSSKKQVYFGIELLNPPPISKSNSTSLNTKKSIPFPKTETRSAKMPKRPNGMLLPTIPKMYVSNRGVFPSQNLFGLYNQITTGRSEAKAMPMMRPMSSEYKLDKAFVEEKIDDAEGEL